MRRRPRIKAYPADEGAVFAPGWLIAIDDQPPAVGISRASFADEQIRLIKKISKALLDPPEGGDE